MADSVAFPVFDANGIPLTSVTPTFVDYRLRDGTSVASPAITHVGGGVYSFTPSDTDETLGVAFLIDTSGGFPARYSGSISNPATPFVAWHLEDQSSALWAGAAPTIQVYDRPDGTPVAAPPVVSIRPYLFAFTPSANDLVTDIAFRIDSPAGAAPAYLAGSIDKPPAVVVVTTPAATTTAEVVESVAAAEPDSELVGSDSLGIHQSDVIIRTALIEAIAELRANPDLLDWVFAGLRADTMSAQSYGDKEIESAKKWFLATQIPIVMVPRLNEAKVPCITIKLVDSNEDLVTLGDVHYDPIQNIDTEPLILVGPTAPIGYTTSTGLLKFSTLGGIFPSVAMSVYDRNGVAHPIVEVVSDLQFKIAAGTVADFSQCTIRSTPPPYAIKMESVRYKETYQIGIHVSGEPVYLTWLHSILVFILLRSKQRLLEARGYEATTFNSTDFDRNEFFEAEFVFSRYINITGYVRHYWPKSFDPTVTSVESALRVIDSNLLPSDTDPNNALWIGEHDFLTPPRR